MNSRSQAPSEIEQDYYLAVRRYVLNQQGNADFDDEEMADLSKNLPVDFFHNIVAEVSTIHKSNNAVIVELLKKAKEIITQGNIANFPKANIYLFAARRLLIPLKPDDPNVEFLKTLEKDFVLKIIKPSRYRYGLTPEEERINKQSYGSIGWTTNQTIVQEPEVTRVKKTSRTKPSTQLETPKPTAETAQPIPSNNNEKYFVAPRQIFKDMVKDIADTFKPYKNVDQTDRDYAQPFRGAKNLYKGFAGITIPTIKFAAKIIGSIIFGIPSSIYQAFTKSHPDAENPLTFLNSEISKTRTQASKLIKDTASEILTGATKMLRGLTQIVTTPLTWFIKIPLRKIITSFTGSPKIEDNRSIKNLVQEANQILDHNVFSSDKIDSTSTIARLHYKFSKAYSGRQKTNISIPAYNKALTDKNVSVYLSLFDKNPTIIQSTQIDQTNLSPNSSKEDQVDAIPTNNVRPNQKAPWRKGTSFKSANSQYRSYIDTTTDTTTDNDNKKNNLSPTKK